MTEDGIFDYQQTDEIENEFDLAAKIKDVIQSYAKVKDTSMTKK